MSLIQDILRTTEVDESVLSTEQRKALRDIRRCRTPELGGVKVHCNSCGSDFYHYRSCGNRNCPVCQGMKQAIWVEERLSEAVDVPYYHAVFTVPSELNPSFLGKPRGMYDILFSAASDTLLTLGMDRDRLGGKIGFICVLHTWGASLTFHPHLHVILPACGLSGDKLVRPKHDGFLFPVRVMSELFRGKFLDRMQRAGFAVPVAACRKDWVVYVKDTSHAGENVISYLGRYTHRVAISDSRIQTVSDSDVTISYKDYRDDCVKEMTLSRSEFIRRFLLHVLPRGFRKIRFYGFLANRNRKKSLKTLRRLLNCTVHVNRFRDLTKVEILSLLYDRDYSVCPCCGSHDLLTETLLPETRLLS